MDLTLNFGNCPLSLRVTNHFKVDYLTKNWKPPDPFHPCQHIKGQWARGVYTVVQGKPHAGEIVSLELER